MSTLDEATSPTMNFSKPTADAEVESLQRETSATFRTRTNPQNGLLARYSQLLADGLPLYGAQGDSISVLQVPRLDLGRVEVIKGVASALYRLKTWARTLARLRPDDEVHVPHVGHDVAELVLKSVGHATAESLPVVGGESLTQKHALDARFTRQQEIGRRHPNFVVASLGQDGQEARVFEGASNVQAL